MCVLGYWVTNRNEWKSAYCWYDPHRDSVENQECKRCDNATQPFKKQPRKKDAGGRKAGDGHHDVERCGMCQRLGYPCQDA
jgi:hypothetical protein